MIRLKRSSRARTSTRMQLSGSTLIPIASCETYTVDTKKKRATRADICWRATAVASATHCTRRLLAPPAFLVQPLRGQLAAFEQLISANSVDIFHVRRSPVSWRVLYR